MNLLQNLFDFEREETSGEVIFFKVFECFVVLAIAFLAWTWGEYILLISNVVLPVGLAHYLDISFMFNNSLPLVNAALITALMLGGFFRLTRYAYSIAFVLLLIQYAARFSLGKVSHSANMIGMTLLCLSIAMIAFDNPLYRRRFALGATYFFVGLGYTLAGISKLVGTGLGWSDGRHLWMWIHEKGVDVLSKTGVLPEGWLQDLILGHAAIATLFLTLGLMSELGAFLLWWRRLRTPVIIAILALHIGIYLIMHIFFYLAVMELVLLGFPWAAGLDKLLQRPAFSPLLQPMQRFTLRFA